MDPISFYINWVLSAVFGQLAEADTIARMDPDAIEHVAGFLRSKHPIKPMPLFRGILLDDEHPFDDDHKVMSVSWSEDLDVARWFASPNSYISVPFRDKHPSIRGYVLTMDPPENVLFHHSWRHAFGRPLEQLALMHPMMGAEGHRQIKWSLDTQREVITAPSAASRAWQRTALGELPGTPLAELDRRFTPPWVEGARHVG